MCLRKEWNCEELRTILPAHTLQGYIVALEDICSLSPLRWQQENWTLSEEKGCWLEPRQQLQPLQWRDCPFSQGPPLTCPFKWAGRASSPPDGPKWWCHSPESQPASRRRQYEVTDLMMSLYVICCSLCFVRAQGIWGEGSQFDFNSNKRNNWCLLRHSLGSFCLRGGTLETCL